MCGQADERAGRVVDDQDDRMQLERLRARRADRDALRLQHVRMQDELKADAHRLEYLTACVAELDAEIERLASPGLGGLLAGWLADGAGRAERLRAKREAFCEQAEALEQAVGSATEALQRLADELNALADIDAAYEALLARCASRGIEDETGQSAALSAVESRRAFLIEQQREVGLAIESGEAALSRVGAMSKALHRSRKHRMHTVGLVSATWNVLKTQSAKPSVERVREGLVRFQERLGRIDVSAETEADAAVVLALGALTGQMHEVSAVWMHHTVRDVRASFPLEMAVREGLGALRYKDQEIKEALAKLDELRAQVQARDACGARTGQGDDGAHQDDGAGEGAGAGASG